MKEMKCFIKESHILINSEFEKICIMMLHIIVMNHKP